MDEELRRHLDGLRTLQRVSRELNAARDLTVTLQTVVDSVVDSLGFGVALINLVHDEVLEVAAVAAVDEAQDIRELKGQRAPRSAWDEILTAAQPLGALLYLPHGDSKLPDEVPSWMPEAATSTEPDAWHPEDVLVAPLYAPGGELVGVLSVDLPATGRMPDPMQRELLEMFAAQAAIAVDNARLHGELLVTMDKLKQEQDALKASEDSFRQAFENAPSGMAMASLGSPGEHRLLRVNAALCEMLGYSDDELCRIGLSTIVHPDDQDYIPVGSRYTQRDMRLKDSKRKTVWVSMTSSVVSNAAGIPDFQLIHFQDISERRLREVELTHRATHDPLTGLPNRAELHTRLEMLVAEGARVAVLYCDLELFKQVNDQYGHDVGDYVLVEIAHRLRTHIRKHDTVARVGGDEFVLVLRDITLEEAETLSSRLSDDVARPVPHGDDLIYVRASIGIGDSAKATTVKELLRAADQAMYRAKAGNRAADTA